LTVANDAELVRQIQNKRLEALGLLYDRYQTMVYRTALAITGDPDAASDLLQDVFLRLYRFADTVDLARPLEPWLYRVTANLSYTWVKRRNRFVRSIEDITEWLAGSKHDQPAQQAELDETWDHLQQAVLSLPISHRMVVVMYYINDLSLQEIAEVLEIPVGTVKSRLHYGRHQLKERLAHLQGDVLPDMQYEYT
jgi:RNA polymerase sigma-70 factor (ECF subfamily)